MLRGPTAIAFDPSGAVLISDSRNNRIRRVSGPTITTLVGNGTAGFAGDNGPASSAQVNRPGAMAFDAAGNLYIADTYNQRIRKIVAGTISTVAGNGVIGSSGDGAPATAASLNYPFAVLATSAGEVWIGDASRIPHLTRCHERDHLHALAVPASAATMERARPRICQW